MATKKTAKKTTAKKAPAKKKQDKRLLNPKPTNIKKVLKDRQKKHDDAVKKAKAECKKAGTTFGEAQ